MSNPTETHESKITRTDWLLARAYYAILLELAIAGKTSAIVDRTITYGGLVTEAKIRNPDIPEVQRAIPMTSGRALGVMRQYVNDKHPDLACLVVRADEKECGTGYTKYFKPRVERAKVLDFNEWASILASFDGFPEREPAKHKRKNRRNSKK
jgi:hypothetical protein